MKKLIVGGATFALSFALALSAHAEANVGEANLERGKMFYENCVACHGANGQGNAQLHAPPIGGKQEWYIVRQLNNFKAGIRGTNPQDIYGAQMRPMAMTLPNEQAIVDVSAYAASLKPPTPKKTIEGNVEAGKAAYAICLACHGANGEGNKTLNAPRLVGLPDWYIVQQLKNFKAGIRGTNPQDIYGMQMRPMSMTLATDEMINNVAAYITTLK